MPLLLQQWDCLFSTTELSGRTTFIAPLLEATVCNSERALALPPMRQALAHSRGVTVRPGRLSVALVGDSLLRHGFLPPSEVSSHFIFQINKIL